MGLKSGSRESGLDEEDEQAATQDEDETLAEGINEAAEDVLDTARSVAESASQAPDCDDDADETEQDQPTMDSIPYKLRRHKVNEGREQVPYFLRPEVIERESELKTTLEEELGETVYKSDYREAAMVVAQRNPELIADVLREWGYDFEKR